MERTNEPKTWKDVWEEFKSPAYWWFIAGFVAFNTALAAFNKWVYHLPSFPKW